MRILATSMVATTLVALWPTMAHGESATPRVADVDWSGVGVIGVSSGLKERVPNVDFTLLPVLVPRLFFDFKSLTFVGQPLEYAASVRPKGAALSVVGTRIAVDTELAVEPSVGSVKVEMGEKAISATVERYGVAYVISIECEKDSDPLCASEQFVRGLVAGLELVGGGRGSPTLAPQTPQASAPGVIGVASDPNFRYEQPGQLAAGTGTGVATTTVFAPGIRFPVAAKPAYLNSQVYGYGGYLGQHSSSGWRDVRNYAYPWRDNFCETRGRKTPACPSGKGHQGVDIRPADSRDRQHVAVAAEAGKIVKVGIYSVTLAGRSGNHYNYLHLEMSRLRVKLGDAVAIGQPIGLISNDFGGEATSVHLHFEVMQNANGRGWRHVPPYASLIAAYRSM